MNRSTVSRAAIVLCTVAALFVGAAPAYAATLAAVHTDSVPTHAMIGAVDLFGLSDADARAVIATGLAGPVLPIVVVKGDGHTLRFSPKGVVAVNVDATLQEAYDASGTVASFDLAPVYSISSARIAIWANKTAAVVNRKPVNARYVVKKHYLKILNARAGLAVLKTTTGRAIRALLVSELASSGLVPSPVVAAVKSVPAQVTRKNIGKAILVRLSKRSIKLYRRTGLEKRYHCAIGQPAYPTPTGLFKIVRKVKLPVWRNPGSAWARRMPAYIGPGRNNPLGTRALYLSAPGIRIHGIPASENWSIGRAASHGCLRMHRHDIENLFPRVKAGIPVFIVR